MTPAALATWWVLTVPPGDPLGPTAQNPDAVRDTACRIVEGSQFCAPPSPPRVDPNAGGGGGLNFLGLFLWALLIAVVLGLAFALVRYFADRAGPGRRGRDHADEVDPDDDALVGTVVRIQGVGFYDFNHGQRGRALNCIELHPIVWISR